MKRTLSVVFGVSCLLFAGDEPKQKVQVVHTEHADLPTGGLLRLKNSFGELTVEGWDRPDVEITTIKSTKTEYAAQDRERVSGELEKVRVSVERQSEGLVVTTDFPHHRGLPFASLWRATDLDLEYHIKVPVNANLAVDHGAGEVYVDNLVSDIHVTVRNGGITLLLPQEAAYNIDAKSDLGGVTAGSPGSDKRKPWLLGHQFVQRTAAAPSLYLRAGFGDITILRMQQPPRL
jgi:hypothetical protein